MLRLQPIVSRLTLALVLVATTLGAAAPSSAQAPSTAVPASQGAALLVGLKSGTTIRVDGHGMSVNDSALAHSVSALGVQSADNVFHAVRGDGQVSLPGLAGAIDLRAVYRLRLPAGANVAAALAALRADPAVVYAEPDAIAHLITTPNDPLYPQQWGLAQIGAPAAWDATTGSASVAIAIVDSGLDTTHPDLAGQLWTNPGEIAGNGLDDDNDGYVDDLHGWNILKNNADLSDSSGHGTEVAGIAAAASNNGAGVAGVCWACKLMVVKVAQPSGVANYSDIAAGVAYAAQKGAKVINLSLGGNSDSITLRAAVTAASATAVVVGGAGNNNSNAPFYPAAYPEALAVAGTTSSDTKVADSDFGTWVDVTAPGESITTTFSGGSYGSSSGTSLAAPFAAGLAGLLFSQHPDWSAAQVRAQIVHTAHNIDAQNPSYVGQLGSGRIDAASGVTTVPSSLLQYVNYAANGQTNGALTVGATLTLAVRLHNDWAATGSVSAVLVSGDSHATVTKPNANWGALGSEQSAANLADPFQVSVQPGAYGLVIPLTLNVLADGVPSTLHFTATTQSVVQTVSGPIASNTTWTSDRVWQATGNIIVNSGVTLTIQPGTLVEFDPSAALLVNGTLSAVGTTDKPIRFTSASATPYPGDWGAYANCTGNAGLHFSTLSQPATFDPSGNFVNGSVLQYATVEYGKGIGISSGPYIDHVLVQHTSGGIVENSCGSTAAPLITNNRVEQNTGTGVSLEAGTAIVRQNLIADNTSALYFVTMDGEVVSNTITGNGGTNCSLPAGTTTICVGVNNITFQGNSIYGNRSTYAVATFENFGLMAADNYWGTTDAAAIDALIFDAADDLAIGPVTYTPFLTQPDPSAPPMLTSLNLTPSSPVGIQHVTFDLTFSAPMDQSLNPIVDFSTTQTTTTYAVLDNAQWLTVTAWRATYDFSSLVPRGVYTLSVSGAKGLDGMEIPSDTRFAFVVDYAGQITDKTPPSILSAFASGVNGNPGAMSASWQAFDANSPIIDYRYAIGSSADSMDVVNWTTIDTTTVGRTGLGLVPRHAYWLSVQAQNQGGLWSPVAASQFVAGVKNNPVAADFYAAPTTGIKPLTVTFTNTSTGDFSSSLWDFGDGITSSLTSPGHVYGATGVFTVTLQTSGTSGIDTKTRAAYITVKGSRLYLPALMRGP